MVALLEKLGDRLLSKVALKETASAQAPPGCYCDWCAGPWAFRCCYVGGGVSVCTTKCVSC